MALVIISGFPCAGKTTRALQIREMLESKFNEPTNLQPKKEVIVVNDEALGTSRSAYDDSKTEKIARASLLSHTIRKLSKDHVVICDGMNYIKGFRYQLYCAAREAGVRICTVHIANLPAHCLAYNSVLPKDLSYREETIQNLFSRYEEPDSSVRWDSPLIVFPWCDSLVSSGEGGSSSDGSKSRGLAHKVHGLRILDDKGEEQCPSISDANGSIADAATLDNGLLNSSGEKHLAGSASPSTNNPNSWSSIAEDIWAAVTQGDLKPVHAAVKTATPTSTNFLHLLETITISVLTSFLSAINNSPCPYGPISFPCVLPDSKKPCIFSINVPMGKTINAGVLQRLKRQYTTMHKQANAAGRGSSTQHMEQIADSFVQYIQGAI